MPIQNKLAATTATDNLSTVAIKEPTAYNIIRLTRLPSPWKIL